MKYLIMTLLLLSSCKKTEHSCDYKTGDKVLVAGRFHGIVISWGSAWESKNEVTVSYIDDIGNWHQEYIDCQLIIIKKW